MFLRFIRWAGVVCGTWYKRVNDRLGVRRVGKYPFPALEIRIKNQIFPEKTEVAISNFD